MMQVLVWALTQCFLKLHSYLAQKYWSWADVCIALIPYIVAAIFSYLAFWESKRGSARAWRIAAALALVLFAVALTSVSIHISAAQTSALNHADDQYRNLLAYSIGIKTGVGSVITQVDDIKQRVTRLESTPQSPETHAEIQQISTQVTTLSNTLQRIQVATPSSSSAPLAPNRTQPVPQVSQTPPQSPTSQPVPTPNARCQVRVWVNWPQKGDFGGVKIGSTGHIVFGAECEGQIGSADLKVVVDGDAFSTDASHLQVNAGGTVHHFVVYFKPSRPGQFTGKLTVLSDDPLKTDFVNPLVLTGTGNQ